MRSTIGMTETNAGRSVNRRALIILAVVAGGMAALLACGFIQHAARAAAQQSGTWTHCADENATCTFTGTKRVRYGAGDTYHFANFTGGVRCSNDVFGDPVYGTVKSCAYQDQQPTATPSPAGTPDYSKVDDILNGRRHLLRTDDLAFIVADTGNFKILQTTDSAISHESGFIFGSTPPQSSSATQIGRMFNLSADVVVTLFGVSPTIWVSIFNPVTNKSQDIYRQHQGTIVHATKMADFNGDGYDDLVVNNGSPEGLNAIQIYTAQDVNNFDAGLKFSNENIYTGEISADAMTIGDFNGDGQPEIIGVIPQADGHGLRLVLHTVDAKTLRISDAVQFPLTIPEGSVVVPHISAAAGKFTTTTHDQLLIAYAANPGTAKVKLIDFDPKTFEPQEQSIWDTGNELKTGQFGLYTWTGLLRLKVGRFNWSSQYDQPLLLHGNNFYREAGTNSFEFSLSTLAINPVDFSIKEQGNLTLKNIGTGDDYGTVSDMVLGNFDRRDPDPQNPQQKNRNPNLQAAILSTDWRGSTAFATIYDIDPTTFAPKQATSHKFSTPLSNGGVRFASGDLQGRSLILGEPTKIVIEGTAQPSVVAAAPPMHVDYMAAANKTEPQVLNLSAIPDDFYTSYQTDETSKTQSSSTNSTSWSFGAKESVGASFEIGSVKDGNGIEFKDTFKAAQDLKGSTEKSHGTYSSHSFNVSQRTGFADQLWLSQTRQNIYVYPVIGKTVCPVSKPDCQDSEKVPLTVQFSGPDQTSYETVAGSQVEWYQPPWEYGNVLSYPGSYSQLQQIVPDIHKLSNDLTWVTDASELTVKTTWATGTSDSQSTSFQQNYSFENDLSVSGKTGFP
ncbi:MAG: VCBS repeat-containing protein, partial [Acidobacteriota bacterium]|nr:VCBS repeat-containing protein [Acidobacteriota bacterium]